VKRRTACICDACGFNRQARHPIGQPLCSPRSEEAFDRAICPAWTREEPKPLFHAIWESWRRIREEVGP